MRKAASIIFMLLIGFFASGQLTLEWEKTRAANLSGISDYNSLVLDESGSIYVTGHYYHDNARGQLFASKYDKDGKEWWTVTYSGTENTESNHGNAIEIGPDGHIYVAGMVAESKGDIGLLKVASDGTVKWAKNHSTHFLGGDRDEAIDLDIDNYGRLYVTSDVISTAGQMEDMFLSIYNDKGSEIWSWQFSGASGSDYPVGIELTSDGTFYSLTGSYNFFGTSTYDFLLHQISSAGQINWENGYGCNDYCQDYPTDFAVKDKATVAMTGLIYNMNQSNYDIGVVKVNEFGTMHWKYLYNGSANSEDTAVALRFDQDGNILVAGNTRELAGNDTIDQIYVAKLDTDGKVVWEESFGGKDDVGAKVKAAEIDNDGSLLLSGYSVSAAGKKEPLLVKVSADGSNLDYIALSTFQNDGAFLDVGVSKDGKIVASGFTNRSNGKSDQLVAQFAGGSLATGFEDIVFNNFAIKPNPADQFVTVAGVNRESSYNIYDLTGRLLQSGKLDAKIDISSLENGCYLLDINGTAHKLVVSR